MRHNVTLARPLSNRLNVRLKTFVSKVITPVVLLAGLLLLALFHFRGVLKLTTQQDQAFQNNLVYSQGLLTTTYQANAGIDRPNITYNGVQLMTYAEWSSRITVDGNVQELWDTSHGYDADQNKRQVFNTMSGPGWQVTQVVTLVNDHTVTVSYALTARKQAATPLQHVTLDIMHVNGGQWAQPQTQGSTFTAEALPVAVPAGNFQAPPGGQTVNPLGKLTVALSGPDVASAAPITIQDEHALVSANGSQENFASAFVTHYTINNPPVDAYQPLGTETITFTPQSTAPGAPISIPAPSVSTINS